MPEQTRKLSEIMKEMSETLLGNPGGVPALGRIPAPLSPCLATLISCGAEAS